MVTRIIDDWHSCFLAVNMNLHATQRYNGFSHQVAFLKVQEILGKHCAVVSLKWESVSGTKQIGYYYGRIRLNR